MKDTVIIFLPKGFNQIGGLKIPINKYCNTIENLYKIKLIEIPLNFNIIAYINLIKKINKLKINEIRAIITFTLNPSYFICKILNISKIRKIAFLMDSLSLYISSVNEFNKENRIKLTIKNKIKYIFKGIIYRFKEKSILLLYDDVIYVSPVDRDFIKKEYQNYIKCKLHVIPNGVDIELSSDKVSGNLKVHEKFISVGFLTTFTPAVTEENLKWFLEGYMPKIIVMIPDIKIIIAGRGASIKQISYLRSFSFVEYIGEVDSVKEFYQSVDVVLSTVKKKCGILNKILEAWALRKCVIGLEYNFDAFPNAENRTHYLAANTVEDYIELFLKIKYKEINIEEIGDNARRLVLKEYLWSKCNMKLLRIIEDD
ncbi:glycosyltransferase family 4 protein [Desulfosporosinus sp. BICA1-9]|uniref:glycosyltransferase family 4 protein n=1 Tax=Desulfosporosinus sp. BICA1-9 TaxID=1531958 RepID=UPI00054B5A84|nr:glycosyltransferase family 4 protein [Desulfosporosinus sp. BICA1-9]KJS49026.1 MAG: hypothetical protein VR66_10790 [Peptococcaceae bacterium BRH_c23]KJS90756.1 MAG: hypothetical protein JL57_00085 [Desulfosporosinus sp. BICA1-9]HBW35502.1 hypothetical protein [Desulfosporosinus sp.]